MQELLVSLAVTFASAPLVRLAMLHGGVMDVPNHRSSHAVPVARGGGIACLGGVLVATWVAATRGGSIPMVAMAACVALAATGFADDRVSMRPRTRLAIQVVAGAAVGLAVGGPLGALLGVILMATAVNIVNFMDGINGITSMTMALWGVVAFCVGRAHGIDALSLLGAVAAGAALGFLPWNAPVARLFLGDAGSYLFGALVAAALLTAWAHHAPVAVVAAPLLVYAADTGWALLSRAARGEKLTEAHRGHVYQVLANEHGLPHLVVSSIAVLLSAVCSVAWVWSPWPVAIAVTGLLGAGYLALPAFLTARKRARRAPSP